MKILIGTPAYGGQVTVQYLQSLIPTLTHLGNDGIQVGIHMLESESLISRGRNTCAMAAINGGYDKLLFIDADIIFTYEKVKMLLDSKHKIVGGTYPLKDYPICLNFNPLDDQCDLFGENRQQDDYIAWVNKYADKNGEAEVKHIPTGFMLIDMEVFAKLSHIVPWYQSFIPQTKKLEHSFEFFPSGARADIHEYESEDWAFCRIAKENGYKIYLQTKAVCGHTGVMHYKLGQHVIRGQEPLIGQVKKQ